MLSVSIYVRVARLITVVIVVYAYTEKEDVHSVEQ